MQRCDPIVSVRSHTFPRVHTFTNQLVYIAIQPAAWCSVNSWQDWRRRAETAECAFTYIQWCCTIGVHPRKPRLVARSRTSADCSTFGTPHCCIFTANFCWYHVVHVVYSCTLIENQLNEFCLFSKYSNCVEMKEVGASC